MSEVKQHRFCELGFCKLNDVTCPVALYSEFNGTYKPHTPKPDKPEFKMEYLQEYIDHDKPKPADQPVSENPDEYFKPIKFEGDHVKFYRSQEYMPKSEYDKLKAENAELKEKVNTLLKECSLMQNQRDLLFEDERHLRDQLRQTDEDWGAENASLRAEVEALRDCADRNSEAYKEANEIRDKRNKGEVG